MHHTDEQMNITTTERIHILEYVFAPVLVTGPMTILFNLPAPSIAVLASLPTLWTFFTHANVRVSFGPLWWMLASPQYHRIHHSIEPQHLNRNFAAYFPLWDIVFGTAYRPKPGEYPMTGVDGLKVSNLWSAFALPFEGWARLYWRRGGGNSREELGSEELGSEVKLHGETSITLLFREICHEHSEMTVPEAAGNVISYSDSKSSFNAEVQTDRIRFYPVNQCVDLDWRLMIQSQASEFKCTWTTSCVLPSTRSISTAWLSSSFFRGPKLVGCLVMPTAYGDFLSGKLPQARQRIGTTTARGARWLPGSAGCCDLSTQLVFSGVPARQCHGSARELASPYLIEYRRPSDANW